MVLKLPWAQKRMFWAFEKGIFQLFANFWKDEVETVFRESEVKCSNLFKFGHKNILRKWFWSNLKLKNECSERLKSTFFSFFANFWVTKLKPFSGKVRQSDKNYLNQNLGITTFLGNSFGAALSSLTNVESV